MQSAKSTALVFVQFASIFILAIRAHFFPNGWLSWSFFSMGMILGIWAILIMKPWQLTIFPEPKAGITLIKNGPYKFIRHPMYTAVLLVCLSWMLSSGAWFDVLLFVMLSINQWIKLSYEESLLIKIFPKEYPRYIDNSKALIPFIL
jgi:protein-S-isoprenylcysteine O-methyltransferase Ste14